jgi:hypothetical protein
MFKIEKETEIRKKKRVVPPVESRRLADKNKKDERQTLSRESKEGGPRACESLLTLYTTVYIYMRKACSLQGTGQLSNVKGRKRTVKEVKTSFFFLIPSSTKAKRHTCVSTNKGCCRNARTED